MCGGWPFNKMNTMHKMITITMKLKHRRIDTNAYSTIISSYSCKS